MDPLEIRELIFLIIVFGLILYLVYKKRKEKYPWKLIVLTSIGIAPIILTPILIFMTPFLFDSPSSTEHITTWLLATLCVLWGPILCGLYYLSYRLYDKHKKTILAVIPQICFYAFVLIIAVIWG